jgi:hypothetical protein
MFAFVHRGLINKQILPRMVCAATLVAAASILTPVPATAFTIDGIVSDDDTYTSNFGLIFELEGKKDGIDNKIVDGGTIRVGRDDTGVFILVEVPIDVVDNVYGIAAATFGSGWVKEDGISPQGHSLGDLLGSDKLEFDLTTNTDDPPPPVVEEGKGGKVKPPKQPRTDPDVSVNYDREGDDGTGVIVYATSLQYNLAKIASNTPGFGDETDSPDPITDPIGPDLSADWVQKVQYEMHLDGSLFGDGLPVPSDLSNFFLHASPNKGKYDNKIKITCAGDCDPNTTTKVPEPGTLSLLGAGLLGLAVYRRRRRLVKV